MLLSKKKIIITLIVAVALGVLVFILPKKIFQKSSSIKSSPVAVTEPAKDDFPKIISTKPDPLDENIVSASEIVEITFNRPLENAGEFKSRIEPKIEYKVELSGDRKTAKIIPAKPYALGTTYTLYIGPDSKFDGVGEWRQDKTFHFKTIKYTGV